MSAFHNQKVNKFNDHLVSLISHNKDGWFLGSDIGRCLEYKNPRESIYDIYRRNKNLLSKYSTVGKLPTVDGKRRQTRLYNEEGVMIIAMRSHQPKADEFCEWAVSILKAYRHGELLSTQEFGKAQAAKIDIYVSEIPEGMIQIPKDEYIELLRIKIASLQ